MNDRNITHSVVGKAWSYLRSGDFQQFWHAARRRITDRQAATVDRWYRDGGESTLRLNYPLTCESIVFDVGGYQGNFTSEIVARYDPHVYVFEPVPEFCELLVMNFRPNPKVKVCNYGLSNRDAVSQMTLSENGSTIYKPSETQITVQLHDIWTVVRERCIKRIDLIKINIEGGEYVLLRRMLETGIVSICQDIQVQFHKFYPNSQRLRSEIRSALQDTHFLTYDYPFVWENWRKGPIGPAHPDGSAQVPTASGPDNRGVNR